jgi:uncharacterized damage-inducible protein DinB
MKNFFINLFNYDCFANKTILDVLIKSNQPAKAVQLMAHLLAAQQVWYNRCKSLPPFTGTLWQDDGKIEEFAGAIRKNNTEWVSYLKSLNPDNFEGIISYKNMKSEPFESKLSDILMHIINHGTHHRAQIGQHLKLAGIENLPVLDYIAYTRQFNS